MLHTRRIGSSFNERLLRVRNNSTPLTTCILEGEKDRDDEFDPFIYSKCECGPKIQTESDCMCELFWPENRICCLNV